MQYDVKYEPCGEQSCTGATRSTANLRFFFLCWPVKYISKPGQCTCCATSEKY